MSVGPIGEWDGDEAEPVSVLDRIRRLDSKTQDSRLQDSRLDVSALAALGVSERVARAHLDQVKRMDLETAKVDEVEWSVRVLRGDEFFNLLKDDRMAEALRSLGAEVRVTVKF